MFFLKLYYTVWVDCMIRLKSTPNRNDWKWYSMAYMTTAMGLNFAVLITTFQKITGYDFYHFQVDVFPGKKLDALISGFTLFFLPLLVTNYLLIFYKNRYRQLVEKYVYSNGKLFMRYFFGSLAVVLFIVVYILTRKVL